MKKALVFGMVLVAGLGVFADENMVADGMSTNLVVNGGFEDNPFNEEGGWKSSQPSSYILWRSGGNPRKRVVLRTKDNADGADYQPVISQTITVQPHTEYEFGFDSDFWGDQPYNNYCDCWMSIYTAGGKEGGGTLLAVIERNCPEAPVNDWLKKSSTFNSGGNTTLVIEIRGENNDHEPEVYIDNVYVTPVAPSPLG